MADHHLMTQDANTGAGGNFMELVLRELSTIKDSVGKIATEQAVMNNQLKGLVDPPNVEHRIKSYVDERDSHKQNSLLQGIANVQHILELQQENTRLRLEAQIKEVANCAADTERARAADHAEEQEHNVQTDNRLAKIEKIIYMGYGMTTLLMIAFKLFWK